MSSHQKMGVWNSDTRNQGLWMWQWMISTFTKQVLRGADTYDQPSLLSFSKPQFYTKSLVLHLKSQFTYVEEWGRGPSGNNTRSEARSG